VPGGPLRVVHCDDSPSFLMLMRHWFEDHPDVRIVHSALGIRDAIEHVRALRPDLIISDTLGSATDPSHLRWLREAAPGARLVIFTGYLERQLDPALRAVADRVVTKGVDERELLAAIRAITGAAPA
jgi:DNA-binding NarL/FixJ family response regulator